MSWSVGNIEHKTFYLEGKPNADGKSSTFPVTIVRLPLIYTDLQGGKTYWTIVFHRNKFGIHYPATLQDVDGWGFYRPNGKKLVQHKETGLAPATLLQRLRAKFGMEFTKKVVATLQT